MLNKSMVFVVFLLITVGCQTGSYDPDNSKSSFGHAKSLYDDSSFDLAIKELNAFIARFPYDPQIQQAEIMLADSYFELGKYVEAIESYRNFSRLYPKSDKREHALYRVGESFWQESPTAINRDQTSTKSACDSWREFILEYPKSSLVDKAKSFILECEKKVLESMYFVADYYCKQSLWHSCAYQYEQIAKEFPKNKLSLKMALQKAAESLEKMLDDKESRDNIYFRTMTVDDIKNKIKKMKDRSLLINTKS